MGSRGRNAFDINLRSIIAFGEIGRGHSSLETFAGFMNMPPPMNKTAYNDSAKQVHIAYTKQARSSIQIAATEIRMLHLHEDFRDDAVADIDISADGSWQRRGYASVNGLVTIISMDSGKCVDYDIMTKMCKSCEAMEINKGSEEYDNYLKVHDCPINHKCSAGSMESAGVRCFQRSINLNNLPYKTYIGDGDSSSYASVVKADPYPGLLIQKGKCIGHIQKRVGSRLRRLKKVYWKTKLSDGKPIGGVGRLTDKDYSLLFPTQMD